MNEYYTTDSPVTNQYYRKIAENMVRNFEQFPRHDFMESVEILSKNIVTLLQMEVHGKVYAHYNRFTDILEVSVTNRVLNIEPFRYHYANLSRDMKNGISSEVISRFVIKEYQDYINIYIFKKY